MKVSRRCMSVGVVLAFALGVCAETFTLTSAAIKETGRVTLSPAGGAYDAGTEVTLAASGGEFVKWVGDVPEGVDATQAEIKVAVTKNMRITPVFRGMWILDRDEKLLYGTVNGLIMKVSDFQSDNSFKLGVENNNKRNIIAGEGVMDLSTPICATDGTEWFAERTSYQAFGTVKMPDCEIGRLTELILPKTLKSFGGQLLNCDGQVEVFIDGVAVTNSCASRLGKVVFDCPDCESDISDWFTSGNGKLTNLILRLPKMQSIHYCGLNAGSFSATDVTQWDLSGLTSLKRANNSQPTYGTFKNKEFFGTMRLPKVQDVGDLAFWNTWKLDGVELGTDGLTLQSIGTNAFTHSAIRKIVFGGAEGWTMKPDSISFAKKLTEVVFLSTPPTIEGGTFVHETDIAPLRCCFYIPRNSPAWADVLKNARSATADDISAYCEAHPDSPVPEYVIPAGTLGTKYDQLVGFVRFADYGIGVEVTTGLHDPRYGGAYESGIDGTYEPGDVVTVTAAPSAETTFAEWYGLPEGAVTNGPTATFTVGYEPLRISYRAAPNWYLDKNAAGQWMISNKVWELNAFLKNSGSGGLGVGTGNGGAYNAHIGRRGQGDLDLTGRIIDVADPAKKWTITAFDNWCFANSGGDTRNHVITSIIFPETTEDLGNQLMNKNAGTAVLTNVVMNVPKVKTLHDFTFNGQGKLTKIVLKIPSVTTIGRFIFNSCGKFVCDLGEWDLRSVTTIGQSFGENQTSVRGCLRLPKITSLGFKTFNNMRMERLELGTDYEMKDQPRLSFHGWSIRDNSALTNLVFGPYAEITSVSNNAFYGCSALKAISFEGRPVATNVLNDIVQSVKVITEQTAPCVIYASRNLGWDKIDGLVALDELNADELARQPVVSHPYQVMGVFESADRSRRAWLVHAPSEYDPKGTLLIVR